jgi:hypothetical protein
MSCARCGGTVYAADRVQALDSEWHKACLTCDQCTVKLNPGIPGLLVPVDGRPYCSKCARTAAAAPASPAVESFPSPSVGSNINSTPPVWAAAARPDFFKPVAAEEEAQQEVVEATPTPEERSPAEAPAEGSSGARSLASKFGSLHTGSAPGAASSPKAASASPTAVAASPVQRPSLARVLSAEGTPKPAVWTPPQPPPLPPPPAPKAAAVAQAAQGGAKAAALAKLGGGVPCARCGKAVYAAEKVLGPGGDWHKACLTCGGCKRSLVAGGWVNVKNDAFCAPCHAKLHGPRGLRGGTDGGMMAA